MVSLWWAKRGFIPTPHAPTHVKDGVDEVDATLLKNVGLNDGQVLKLPTAVEGQILRRGAVAWEAY